MQTMFNDKLIGLAKMLVFCVLIFEFNLILRTALVNPEGTAKILEAVPTNLISTQQKLDGL